jgi:hypothetical protein
MENLPQAETGLRIEARAFSRQDGESLHLPGSMVRRSRTGGDGRCFHFPIVIFLPGKDGKSANRADFKP